MLYLDGFKSYLLAERRYSPLTAGAYIADVEQFGKFLATDDPALATRDDIKEWIVHLSSGKKKIAARSINRKLSSVRSFFRYLQMKGIVEEDLFSRITSLKTPGNLPSFVEESRMANISTELLALSDDFITERDSLMLLLFYATGIRLAELTGIKKNDFHDDFSTLRVIGKGDKERIVPVMEQLKIKMLNYLKIIREENICTDDNFLLFLRQDGRPVSRSHVYRNVRNLLGEAGVQGKRSPHILRHTFATHMLGGEAGLRSIQELLGHTSLAATQVYTHNSIKQLKKVYDKAHPRAKDEIIIKNTKEEKL